MERVNKKDLAVALRNMGKTISARDQHGRPCKIGLTQVGAQQIVDELMLVMTDALQCGLEVHMQKFGALRPVTRAARKGRNPRSGAAVPVPAQRTVVFKAGTELKKAVNAQKNPRLSE